MGLDTVFMYLRCVRAVPNYRCYLPIPESLTQEKTEGMELFLSFEVW